MNVVHQLTSRTNDDLGGFYRKKADLGSLVEYALLKRKPQPKSLGSFLGQNESEDLTIEGIHEYLTKIASYKGKGSQKAKKNQLLQVLRHSSPLEAKYVARIITSDTRTGFRGGLLLDAIAPIIPNRLQNLFLVKLLPVQHPFGLPRKSLLIISIPTQN